MQTTENSIRFIGHHFFMMETYKEVFCMSIMNMNPKASRGALLI